MNMQTKTSLTCPKCGAIQKVTMPTDACQFFTNVRNAVKRSNQNLVIAVSFARMLI